jgi:hypothetical protein
MLPTKNQSVQPYSIKNQTGLLFCLIIDPANDINLLDSNKKTLSECCTDPLRPPEFTGLESSIEGPIQHDGRKDVERGDLSGEWAGTASPRGVFTAISRFAPAATHHNC